MPDTAIRKVAAELVPKVAAGHDRRSLDAAAPYAGHLPERTDITYFVTHPCHPPIFNDETDGRGAATTTSAASPRKQAIVNALMQGPEEHYAVGEEIAKTIWQPILRSHRVTVEQMAMLEPGLSRDGLRDAARRHEGRARRGGAARASTGPAARDFLIGHMNILAAVTFEEIQGVFSDACNKAIENGKPRIFRDDWLGVFEPAEIAESIRRIT